MFKSGFVTIVGRPNVGKSTFINGVLKQKIAIMSDKAQTTRNKIHGVYTDDESQIIFIDTPGIHKPKHELGKVINDMATSSIDEVDIILFMVPFDEPLGKGDKFILSIIENNNIPIYLLINKIDLAKNKNEVLTRIAEYNQMFNFDEIIPISALKLDNVDHLIKVIKENLNEGPKYYPVDMITNHPEKFIIQEIIREKVLHLTKEEVPHAVAVVVESMEKDDEGYINIVASIIIERKSQKGIIIGKQGSMLTKIGSRARKEIKKRLGSPVFLDLWVKVQKDWRNNLSRLNEFGYKNDDY
ncbi:GTPase Era [Mycoplasmatota bacterium]|nr:GTPase Era [Mycoplasmatota bacterium]